MRNQRVVLFLGAGASMESVNKEGERPPLADHLRQLLGQKFFGQPMDGYDLTFLSEMAIQAHGQALVFEHIREYLDSLPSVPSTFSYSYVSLARSCNDQLRYLS